uniref:trypsin n=1 Tax=Hucho hucho TaxID=62062 RepID=A0A4W5RFD8_9TELE
MLCAGKQDWSQDACKGDSRGPMVCDVDNRMFFFGIVSWDEECSRALRPDVYTTVTKYNKWIEENTVLSSFTSGSMYPQK